MADVRGNVLRPPHGTTPAAVKSNKNQIKPSYIAGNVNVSFLPSCWMLQFKITSLITQYKNWLFDKLRDWASRTKDY